MIRLSRAPRPCLRRLSQRARWRNTTVIAVVLAILAVAPLTALSAQTAVDSAAIYFGRATELNKLDVRRQSAAALMLFRRSLELYRERSDSTWAATVLLEMGITFRRTNQEDSAKVMMLQARDLRRARGDRAGEAAILFELGMKAPIELIRVDDVWRVLPPDKAAYRAARDYLLEAGRLWVSAGDSTHQVQVLAQAGLYWLEENADSAVAYTARALRIARMARDTSDELTALNQLSLVHVRLFLGFDDSLSLRRAPRDSALKYIRLAMHLGRAFGDAQQEARAIRNIISIYSAGTRTPQVYEPDSVAAYSGRLVELTRLSKSSDRREEINALLLASDRYVGVQVDSALSYARAALALSRAHADSLLLDRSLEQMQRLELRLGWPDSALMRIRERSRLAPTLTSAAQLNSMRDLSSAHESRGQSDSAEYYLRSLLSAGASLPGLSATNRESVTAGANFELLSFFLRRNRPDSALRYLRPPSNDSLSTSYRFNDIGKIHLARGQLDSADVSFSRSVAWAGSSARQRAIATSWLMSSDLATDRLDSAIVRGRRVLNYFTKRNIVEEANALSQLSTAYARVGQPDTAIALYRSALALWERTGNRRQLASGLDAVASMFLNADVQDSAFVYGRRSLAVAALMDSPLAQATPLANLGVSYAAVGQRDSATVYHERSAQLNRQYARDGALATNLANLAFGRINASRLADDSTFTLLRESLALTQRTQNRRIEGLTRQYLARAFVVRGQPDSALAQGRLAVTLLRETGYRAFEGRALAEMGSAFAALNQPDSARVYFTEAVRIMRAEGFTRGVRMTLATMAELFRSGSQRDLQRAVAYYDSAAATVESARRSAGSDENTVALAEGEVDVFAGWARAWAGRADEVGPVRSAASALGAVERGRSQALQDLLSQLLPVAERRAVLQPAAGGDLAIETDSLLSSLRASGQAALSYLHAADTLFTWVVAPNGAVSLYRTGLPAGELALLVRSSRRAFGADDARNAPLDPDELKRPSAADSAALAARNADADLRRLAELLLPAELETLVPIGTPLVVVPHGTIALVPFAALEARARGDSSSNAAPPAASRTLGARHALRFSPSFAALRATEARPRTLAGNDPASPARPDTARIGGFAATRPRAASGTPATRPANKPAINSAASTTRTRQLAQSLVVGNPSMPGVYAGRWSTRAQLQSLPGAEAEGRRIAAQLGAHVLTGKDATETVVRARLADATVVHFATHGLAYGAASAARRSYVAFAPDAQNDGLLTLGELMDDPTLVMRAELVVLSACQTGLGDLKQAEGTIGLQRAFLAKGARSVLVSLWNVDDAATRLLMERFYFYWLGDTPHTKAQSLQLAQRDVRARPQYAHPKYWAGFQLVGAD